MKKFVFLVLIFIFMPIINAEELSVTETTVERTTVNLVKCENATNFWIDDNGVNKQVHLLAYDKMDGNLNNDINAYACKLLTDAKTIEIEKDQSTKEIDKYHRYLLWVYVDGELLQNKLIEKGYGEVNYVTTDLSNLDTLCASEATAIKDKLGVWNYDNVTEAYCKSDVSNLNNEKKEDTNTNNNKQIDIKVLKKMNLYNSGILILVILLNIRKKGFLEW